MKEWFKEFQIACAKSEEVMQKTSKLMRQLQNSSGGVYGSVVDEDGVDSIRFCDVTPNTRHALTQNGASGAGDSSTIRASGGVVKAEAVPVLPAAFDTSYLSTLPRRRSSGVASWAATPWPPPTTPTTTATTTNNHTTNSDTKTSTRANNATHTHKRTASSGDPGPVAPVVVSAHKFVSSARSCFVECSLVYIILCFWYLKCMFVFIYN